MATSGVNVLRWSALAAGVLYGFYHQSTITAKEKIDAINRQYQHKADLIAQARAEYKKKTMPQESKTAGGDIITDPMDPKFDLEAYLTMKDAGQK